MKQIPLTQGKSALIDDEDFDRVSQFNWHLSVVPWDGNFLYYAQRAKSKQNTKTTMHRFLMNAPKGVLVDHKNGDGLDNRRCNLRLCNYGENSRNRRRNSRSKYKYKGVYRRSEKSWYVRIRDHGKRCHVGSFASEIEAARAYDAKAKELFGDFACLNFPL